jgi:hypothetical protein
MAQGLVEGRLGIGTELREIPGRGQDDCLAAGPAMRRFEAENLDIAAVIVGPRVASVAVGASGHPQNGPGLLACDGVSATKRR